jgi:hypothetical protein
LEHSTDNQLQLPVTINGVDFPRLEMQDLFKWAKEARDNARTEAEKRYAKNGPGGALLTEFDRQRMIQAVIDRGIELSGLLDLARTPEGIHRVLILSLKKAGKSDGDALAALKGIHFIQQFQLAQDVLSPPAPPAEPAPAPAKGEDEPPLPEGVITP